MSKILKGLVLLTMVVTALAAGGLFRFWVFLHQPGSADMEPKVISVKPGMHFRDISNLLSSQGFISNPLFFRILCRLRKSDQSLQAGEYRLSAILTPEQVLSRLRSGEVTVYRVTFPEGSTLHDVARILAAAGLTDQHTFLELMQNADFAHSLGVSASTLEGYLFPDTYFFVHSQKPTAILREMVRQFHKRIDPLWQQRPSADKAMSLQEAVILASLVEKEAATADERPLIAAVFRNRLKLHMRLQSDPTTVYDLEGFDGPVTADQLKRESPYNTYLHPGLPPGPICNPGISSFEAAIATTDVPYLYFVSNADGTHTFSKTLSEHQRAVNEYRRKRRQQP